MKWTAYIWSLKLIKFTSRLCGSRTLSKTESMGYEYMRTFFFLKEILQETKQQPRGNKKSKWISILKSRKEEILRSWKKKGVTMSIVVMCFIIYGIRNLCVLRKVSFVNVVVKVIVEEVKQLWDLEKSV